MPNLHRTWLAALLLASPLSAQVVSLKPSVAVLTGAPGAVSFQAPAPLPGLSVPTIPTRLTPSLSPSLAPALVPALLAPAAPVAAVTAQWAIAPMKEAVRAFADGAPEIPLP